MAIFCILYHILPLNLTQKFYIIQKQPPEVFCEKRFFRNFANFTGKTCVRDSF